MSERGDDQQLVSSTKKENLRYRNISIAGLEAPSGHDLVLTEIETRYFLSNLPESFLVGLEEISFVDMQIDDADRLDTKKLGGRYFKKLGSKLEVIGKIEIYVRPYISLELKSGEEANVKKNCMMH